MKISFLVLMLSVAIFSGQSLYADSPLTSTDFSRAYINEKMVTSASETKGLLTTKLMEWLASEENPAEVKMAIINTLGWDKENRNNSLEFFNYLKNTRGYSDQSDFEKRGRDFELLCMAYLIAMENYFEVDDAIRYAELAKDKNPGSYTFNMILSLIKAQNALNSDWCKVYLLTNSVREDKSLNHDLRNKAIKIIFQYMDLYKDSCVK